MAKKLLEVKNKIHASKAFIKRGEKVGRVGREDILDVLNIHADPDHERENVSAFLDSLDPGILDHNDKQRILNDLKSYRVAYKRK